MLDNPRGENRRRLPIRSPGVLGYCQGSFQCCHWYCQSFFKVGIVIPKDIFKVVIDIFEVVNCSLFTNLTTSLQRCLVSKGRWSDNIMPPLFFMNTGLYKTNNNSNIGHDYWITTLKIPSEMEVALCQTLLILFTLFTLFSLLLLLKLLYTALRVAGISLYIILGKVRTLSE